MTSSRDWPAFLCPVRTKPSPWPCLGHIRPYHTLQVWASPAHPRWTHGASPACTAEPDTLDCVGALTMQSLVFSFFPSPSSVLEQCAHCQHMQLLIACSRSLQFQQGQPHYSWHEEQGSSVVWAISPLWPLLLLPLCLRCQEGMGNACKVSFPSGVGQLASI